MAEEVDKVAQQDQATMPAPSANPPSENHDVEMSEAPPANESEQSVPVASAAPVDEAKPPIPEEPPAKAPKQAVLVVGATQEDSKPVEATSEAVGPVSEAAPPAAPAAAVGNEEKPAEVNTEKPAGAPIETPVDKVEAAEDASVKMLAANLEVPSNGEASAEPPSAEPETTAGLENGNGPAITGEKRKAEDSVGTNGDPSNKKSNVEATPDTPTTNGSAPPRKPGRPKKDKKAPAPVGKTARRTRSQGAADL